MASQGMDQNDEGSKSEEGVDQSVWKSIGFAWELGYVIALPIVLLGLMGRILDRAYDSSPLFVLIGFTAAVGISGFFIYRKIKAIERRDKRHS